MAIFNKGNVQGSVMPAASSMPMPLLPVDETPNGPCTQARWRRTMTMFAIVWLCGAALQILEVPTAWKVFGQGLFLPGGGFFYAGHPWLGGLFFLLFGVSLFLLWMLGPVLLPPLIWIGGAVLAGIATVDDVSAWSTLTVPAALVAIITIARYIRKRESSQARVKGMMLNEELRSLTVPVIAERHPEVTESTPEDLESLRYCLDLALQPMDRWDGFHMVAQFREAAVRYQLNFVQYACAMSQYTRTPAFTGYLAEAQRNMIEKMLIPVVWKYWRWENLWGNLEWNPDPVIRDNVMLSGYWSVMVGLYQSLNKDMRYSTPGSLTFNNGPREHYPYDFNRLAEVLHRNMMKDRMCLFPCEPKWIYPFCASYAMNTLILHDRMSGSRNCDDALPNYRRAFEQEFMLADGRTVAAKEGRWGFNVISAPVTDAATVFWNNPIIPDIAQRNWWAMRKTLVHLHDGRLDMKFDRLVSVDAGNYVFNKGLFVMSLLQYAAREMGDEDAYLALQKAIDEIAEVEISDGRRRYPMMSVYGNLQHVLGRFCRKNAMHEMINRDLPEAWSNGPLLEEAPYPQVLVAKAVSDGQALDLVLRPGDQPGISTLGLSRLCPGRRYRVEGAVTDEITANFTGKATIEVALSNRHEIRILPA